MRIATRRKILDYVANSYVYSCVDNIPSTTQIAKSVGVTQPALAYHFKTLLNLKREAYAHAMKKYANSGVAGIIHRRESMYNSPVHKWELGDD